MQFDRGQGRVSREAANRLCVMDGCRGETGIRRNGSKMMEIKGG